MEFLGDCTACVHVPATDGSFTHVTQHWMDHGHLQHTAILFFVINSYAEHWLDQVS